MNIRTMQYTKANGEVSTRQVIVVSNPKENYLMYDVSKLTEKELQVLQEALKQTEEFRDNAIADFELLTGIKQASLWRTFKPEGIEWEQEDDTV